MKTVVLFDGVCNLCHRSVQFILRHDRAQRFVFASQQSEVGQQLLRQYGVPTEAALADSLVVIEGARVWLESDAALHILYRLGGVAHSGCAAVGAQGVAGLGLSVDRQKPLPSFWAARALYGANPRTQEALFRFFVSSACLNGITSGLGLG